MFLEINQYLENMSLKKKKKSLHDNSTTTFWRLSINMYKNKQINKKGLQLWYTNRCMFIEENIV